MRGTGQRPADHRSVRLEVGRRPGCAGGSPAVVGAAGNPGHRGTAGGCRCGGDRIGRPDADPRRRHHHGSPDERTEPVIGRHRTQRTARRAGVPGGVGGDRWGDSGCCVRGQQRGSDRPARYAVVVAKLAGELPIGNCRLGTVPVGSADRMRAGGEAATNGTGVLGRRAARCRAVCRTVCCRWVWCGTRPGRNRTERTGRGSGCRVVAALDGSWGRIGGRVGTGSRDCPGGVCRAGGRYRAGSRHCAGDRPDRVGGPASHGGIEVLLLEAGESVGRRRAGSQWPHAGGQPPHTGDEPAGIGRGGGSGDRSALGEACILHQACGLREVRVLREACTLHQACGLREVRALRVGALREVRALRVEALREVRAGEQAGRCGHDGVGVRHELATHRAARLARPGHRALRAGGGGRADRRGHASRGGEGSRGA